MQIKLPYFDLIFARLEAQDADFEAVFNRHVHFGYWADPEHEDAYKEETNSVGPMNRLCQLLIELADIRNGQNVLDVGCGFGGTLATINDQFTQMGLTGLNIDPRQIEQARKRWSAKPTNQLQFLVGDACEMVFPAASFDRITAVECIFHFPSRRKFFEHVRRTLRPGGNLTMTDFLQPEGVPLGMWDVSDECFWGAHSAINLSTYHELAAEYGLKLVHCQDISRNITPTYHYFALLLGQHYPGVVAETDSAQFMTDNGHVAYCTLRLDRIDE